ncbi:MAG TPA: hypothetical protein VE258_09365, partial [Ktedonobacterales bacterium]|nr:hypothetical protein [Ktedonobacterales bacterium]
QDVRIVRVRFSPMVHCEPIVPRRNNAAPGKLKVTRLTLRYQLAALDARTRIGKYASSAALTLDGLTTAHAE